MLKSGSSNKNLEGKLTLPVVDQITDEGMNIPILLILDDNDYTYVFRTTLNIRKGREIKADDVKNLINELDP